MLPIKLKLRFYGESVLRRKARCVTTVTDKERAISSEMAEIMHLAGGIGLAAPQVGINKQIIVIDIGEGPCVFINPKITKRLGCEVKEEGCLSLPGVFVRVRRAKKITVCFLNEHNEEVSVVVDNLLARVVQHEMDHLKGKLLIDYVGFFKKLKLKKMIKKYLKQKKNEIL